MWDRTGPDSPRLHRLGASPAEQTRGPDRQEPIMSWLVGVVLVLLVVAWFVPAVRPLVALALSP